MTHQNAAWTLVRPNPRHAGTIASWSRSARETEDWCSRTEHPVPTATILEWWQQPDVAPWLLLDPDGIPCAYGEVWDDADEDESELARLVVDHARRRTGLGRRLVDRLIALAQAGGRSSCYIRVAPGNNGALELYRSAGFHDVDQAVAADWNQGQPAEYRWLEYPDLHSATP